MRLPCLNPQLVEGAAGHWLSPATREGSDQGGSCLVQTLGFKGKLTNYIIQMTESEKR